MTNRRRRLAGCSVVLVSLIVACIGASLSTTSQMVITTDYNPFYFGSVQVGSSGSGNITISPVYIGETNHVLAITPLSGCSEFAVNPGSLPTDVYFSCVGGETGGQGYGSASCTPITHTFGVGYTPTGPGSASCNVSITYSTGSGSAAPVTSYTVMLIGTGSAPTQGMTVMPTSEIQFGDVRIGSTSASQKVTVKNTGTQSLSVTSSASGGPTFGITPAPGTINLGPGATRDYLVSCTPQVPTELAGSLTFSAGNLVASASYSCNGVASFLDIVPSPAAFDDALVGAPPPNVTVTITNVNEVETEISDIALDPAAIAAGVAIATLPQIPITLQPNDFIAVPLSYTAASQHTGTLGGLIVTESGSPSRTVPISGEALLGEIGTSPSSVEFGPICGDTTATRDVMVYAAAAGDIDLESITKPESPFDTTTPTGTLTGNHGPGITLTTSVSSSTAGEVTGSLVLNSNAPADRMHEVPMTALVLPPGVSPTPEAVQFGGAMVGGLTTGKQVTITNCTAAAVDITDVRIEGPDATEFSIVSPETVQASIDQRGGQTYLLVLSPRSVGLKSAQLVVEYAGERKIVDLDGNGFADPSDATERTTYYDCSTTGGAGAWPIALALLGVTRRRRNRQVSRSDRATE